MLLLYDLLTVLVGPVMLPVAFFKGLATGRALASLTERLTFYRSAQLVLAAGRRVIWVHAVSVGEVNASRTLLQELKKRCPDAVLILSCITLTGRQIAETLPEVDLPLFLPVDLPFLTRRALRLLRPDLVVLVETELWPNFILQTAAQGIPLVLVNGRLSKRSFSRYRYFRPYLQRLLQSFSWICAQDAATARRLKALGAAPERVSITGNVKFDLFAREGEDGQADLAALLPLSEYVWVAGSTHSGEHEQVVRAHQLLLDRGIPSYLVLAPRHPQQFEAVAEMLGRRQIPFARRSQPEAGGPDPARCQILLLDTLGELNRIYRYADVVFVGGSLVPEGGHNLLEPARDAKPVLFGPHMFENRQMVRLMLAGKGGRQVADPEELAQALEILFEDPPLRRRMGESARQLVERNSGATRKTLQQLEPFLVCSHE